MEREIILGMGRVSKAQYLFLAVLRWVQETRNVSRACHVTAAAES